MHHAGGWANLTFHFMPTFSVLKRLSSICAAVLILIMVIMWSLHAGESKAAGITYHVASNGNDSNSCSAAQSTSSAKRTIQAGVNCATQPGDIVSVHAGTYTETVSFSHSGSSGNPIRVQPNGYTNDGCGTPGCGSGDAVTWSGGATSPAAILTDVSHIRIQGFTIANTQTSTSASNLGTIQARNSACGGAGCKDNPREGIEILNNTFSNNGSPNGITNGAISGIVVFSAIGRHRSAGNIQTSEISGNTFSGNAGAAVYLISTSNTRIANNNLTSGTGALNTELGGPWYFGGLMYGYAENGSIAMDYLLFEGNTVANVTDSRTPQELSGIRYDHCQSNVGTVIQDNVFHDIHNTANNLGAYDIEGYGIFFESDNCHVETVQRNIIYNVGFVGMRLGSQATGGPITATIAHNTIWHAGRAALYMAAATNITVRNNILHKDQRSPSLAIGMETLAVSRGGHTFRNNLY
jgi:parallel beta-helix repeat protein